MFTNAQKTECVDYSTLKTLHKATRDESLAYFKEKAVGSNLKEYESKIIEEIQKKYMLFK